MANNKSEVGIILDAMSALDACLEARYNYAKFCLLPGNPVVTAEEISDATQVVKNYEAMKAKENE